MGNADRINGQEKLVTNGFPPASQIGANEMQALSGPVKHYQDGITSLPLHSGHHDGLASAPITSLPLHPGRHAPQEILGGLSPRPPPHGAGAEIMGHVENVLKSQVETRVISPEAQKKPMPASLTFDSLEDFERITNGRQEVAQFMSKSPRSYNADALTDTARSEMQAKLNDPMQKIPDLQRARAISSGTDITKGAALHSIVGGFASPAEADMVPRLTPDAHSRSMSRDPRGISPRLGNRTHAATSSMWIPTFPDGSERHTQGFGVQTERGFPNSAVESNLAASRLAPEVPEEVLRHTRAIFCGAGAGSDPSAEIPEAILQHTRAIFSPSAGTSVLHGGFGRSPERWDGGVPDWRP